MEVCVRCDVAGDQRNPMHYFVLIADNCWGRMNSARARERERGCGELLCMSAIAFSFFKRVCAEKGSKLRCQMHSNSWLLRHQSPSSNHIPIRRHLATDSVHDTLRHKGTHKRKTIWRGACLFFICASHSRWCRGFCLWQCALDPLLDPLGIWLVAFLSRAAVLFAVRVRDLLLGSYARNSICNCSFPCSRNRELVSKNRLWFVWVPFVMIFLIYGWVRISLFVVKSIAFCHTCFARLQCCAMSVLGWE